MSTRRAFVESSFALAVMCCSQASFARSGGGARDDKELLELSATEASKWIQSGDLSSERYAASLLAQCNRNSALNAFIWLNRDGILKAARASDQQRPKHSNFRLRGLPIVLKDNIDTKDAPTTGGTPADANVRRTARVGVESRIEAVA